MKGNERLFKNQKYFNFLKMDKKNVQNRKVKMLLTEKKFCLDSKKLSSQIKPEKIFLKSIFFIFFAEKYLGIFSLALIS
jgi:hypothetical protein